MHMKNFDLIVVCDVLRKYSDNQRMKQIIWDIANVLEHQALGQRKKSAKTVSVEIVCEV